MRFAFFIATVVSSLSLVPPPDWLKHEVFVDIYCNLPEGQRVDIWWEEAEEILTKNLKTITSLIHVSKSFYR